MIRRLALTVGCIVLSAVAFSGKAHAQSVKTDAVVPFSGVVGGVCEFTNIQEGTLKANGGNIGSDPDDFPGAVSAKLNIACNTGATLSLADPVQTAGPSITTGNFAQLKSASLPATVSSKGSNANSTPQDVAAGFSGIGIELDMFAAPPASGPMKAGTYEYDVTVTATPK